MSCRQRYLVCAAATILWAVFSNNLYAQQQHFERQKTQPSTSTDNPNMQLSYQWIDAQSQTQSLSFSVNRKNFLKPLGGFRNFDRKRANRELAHQLNRYLQQQRWHGVTVSLSPRQQRLQIGVAEAPSRQQQQQFQQQAEKLKSYYQQQWQNYLDANYYRLLRLPSGEQGIVPDAVAIANAQESLFKSLAQAAGEQLRDNSRRNYYNYIGQFIQSLPYTTLEDGIDDRGDGFIPPNQLLYYNRGDCDSKATLLASVLRPIIPEARMAIVYLPGHAVFALAMSSTPDDVSIRHQGADFVLMEVAGPAMMKAGQISDNSAFYINSGQYRVVEIQ